MVVSGENNLFFNRKVHCPFVCVTQMPRMMFTSMMNWLQRIMQFSVLIIHLHHYLLLDRYYSFFIELCHFLFPKICEKLNLFSLKFFKMFVSCPFFIIHLHFLNDHILIEPWQRRWMSAASSLRSPLFHPRTAAILKPASCFCSVCTIH